MLLLAPYGRSAAKRIKKNKARIIKAMQVITRTFSSPEPVVSWSRGRETRGYKSYTGRLQIKPSGSGDENVTRKENMYIVAKKSGYRKLPISVTHVSASSCRTQLAPIGNDGFTSCCVMLLFL